MDILPTDTSSRVVRVRMRWVPWRPRYRKVESDFSDALSTPDFGDSPLAGLAFLVLAIFIAVGGLGLLVFPIELTVVALVAALLALMRLVGVLPWHIVTETADGRSHVEEVRGTVAARRRLREMRGRIDGL